MSTLAEQCYLLLKQIPKGKVTTYKALADALGTKAYRHIGQIMKNNPRLDLWPCYKVVCSDGKIGGYTLGQNKKIELLENDGLLISHGKIKDLKTSIRD